MEISLKIFVTGHLCTELYQVPKNPLSLIFRGIHDCFYRDMIANQLLMEEEEKEREEEAKDEEKEQI